MTSETKRRDQEHRDQPGLWDSPTMSAAVDSRPASGEELKQEGMARAADAKSGVLSDAQEVARQIGREKGTAHADDVCERMGADRYEELGNAAGSIFRGSEWQSTGEFHKSTRPQSHGNLLRIWRYVG